MHAGINPKQTCGYFLGHYYNKYSCSYNMQTPDGVFIKPKSHIVEVQKI